MNRGRDEEIDNWYKTPTKVAFEHFYHSLKNIQKHHFNNNNNYHFGSLYFTSLRMYSF